MSSYIIYALATIGTISLGKRIYGYVKTKRSTASTPKGEPTEIIIDTTTKQSKSQLSNFVFGSSDNKALINKNIYESFKEIYSRLDITDDFTLRINTLGGELFYGLLISQILYRHKGKIHCVIDNYAMSAGSLIALCCDDIKMSQIDVVGPVDPQVFGVLPAKSIVSILTGKSDRSTLEALLLDISGGCIEGYLPLFKKFLTKHHSEETVNQIVDLFFYTSKNHSSIIVFNEFKEIIGDKLIDKDAPKETTEETTSEDIVAVADVTDDTTTDDANVVDKQSTEQVETESKSDADV
jgi:hypothetical protein